MQILQAVAMASLKQITSKQRAKLAPVNKVLQRIMPESSKQAGSQNWLAAVRLIVQFVPLCNEKDLFRFEPHSVDNTKDKKRAMQD